MLSLPMEFSTASSPLVLFLSAVICFIGYAIRPVEAVRTENLTVYTHSAINVTDYVVLPGVAGVGSNSLTAQQGPFGSMFVYNEPMTVSPDPASQQLGTVQGTGVTTSFNGTTFFIASTATFFNTTQYSGSFTQSGLSGGKIPITGGTDYFLFAQGYTLSSYYSISGFNITYQIDIYLYWPPYE